MVKQSPVKSEDAAAKKKPAESVFKDALPTIPRKRRHRGRRGGRRRRRRRDYEFSQRLYIVVSDESHDIYNEGRRVLDYTRLRVPIYCVCTNKQAAQDKCMMMLNDEMRAMRNRGVECWKLRDDDLRGQRARIPGSMGWVGIGSNDRNLRRTKWTWVEFEANKIQPYVAVDEQTWTPEQRSPVRRRSRTPSPSRSPSPCSRCASPSSSSSSDSE